MIINKINGINSSKENISLLLIRSILFSIIIILIIRIIYF